MRCSCFASSYAKKSLDSSNRESTYSLPAIIMKSFLSFFFLLYGRHISIYPTLFYFHFEKGGDSRNIHRVTFHLPNPVLPNFVSQNTYDFLVSHPCAPELDQPSYSDNLPNMLLELKVMGEFYSKRQIDGR